MKPALKEMFVTAKIKKQTIKKQTKTTTKLYGSRGVIMNSKTVFEISHSARPVLTNKLQLQMTFAVFTAFNTAETASLV